MREPKHGDDSIQLRVVAATAKTSKCWKLAYISISIEFDDAACWTVSADDVSSEQYAARDGNFAKIFYQKFYFWRIARQRISFLHRELIISSSSATSRNIVYECRTPKCSQM